MGQYFKLANPDRKEFVDLPGGMKAIERVTNSIAMGMIGYLLLEGPQDGTVFSYQMDVDELEDEIDEVIEREEQFEEEKDRESMYRDDDGSWNREQISTVAAAGLKISEANEYAGRWAGNEVTLIGDYAERDLYDTASDSWVYEHKGEEFVTYATASGPIVPESIERDDIEHSIETRDVEPGDLCYVRKPGGDEKVYANFVEVAEGVWTNITDELTEEFVEFVGEDWIESSCENSLLRPDAVINV